EEWRAFTQAKPGAQVPLLKRSLRAMRNGELTLESNPQLKVKHFTGIILQSLKSSINKGEPYKQFPQSMNFTERIASWKISLESFDIQNYHLSNLITYLNS